MSLKNKQIKKKGTINLFPLNLSNAQEFYGYANTRFQGIYLGSLGSSSDPPYSHAEILACSIYTQKSLSLSAPQREATKY